MHLITSFDWSPNVVSVATPSRRTSCHHFKLGLSPTRIAAQNFETPTNRPPPQHITQFFSSVSKQHIVHARCRRGLPAPLCSSASQADDDSEEDQKPPDSTTDVPEPSPSSADNEGPPSPELSSLLSQLSGLTSTNAAPPDTISSPTEDPKTPKLYSHLDQLPKNPPSPPSAPAPSIPLPPSPPSPSPSLTRADKAAILASLATLTESITSLSASLESVSSNVRFLATAVQGSDDSPSSGTWGSFLEPVREVEVSTPDPWGGLSTATSDPAQQLMFRIQRAFVQARITGLGKPPEMAMSDFIDACMAAREGGVDLPQLQLKLIVIEGSLPPPFSPSTSTGQPNPFIAEEGRIRAIWIRFVYVALDYVQARRSGVPKTTGSLEDQKGDPMDDFVIQTLELAVNNGRTFEMVRAEHSEEGPAGSQATQMMRQSQCLILMTLKKATFV